MTKVTATTVALVVAVLALSACAKYMLVLQAAIAELAS